MRNRTELLNKLVQFYQTIAPATYSWRRAEKKNEIWIGIVNETRNLVSELLYQADVVLEVQISYIFESNNIDGEIENKRVALITTLFNETNYYELVRMGYKIRQGIRVMTEVIDDNSAIVTMFVEFEYKDDNY